MSLILVYNVVAIWLVRAWFARRTENSPMKPMAYLNNEAWEEVFGSLSVTIPLNVMQRCAVGKNFVLVYAPNKASRSIFRDQCESDEQWNRVVSLLSSIPNIDCYQIDKSVTRPNPASSRS